MDRFALGLTLYFGNSGKHQGFHYTGLPDIFETTKSKERLFQRKRKYSVFINVSINLKLMVVNNNNICIYNKKCVELSPYIKKY